MVSANVCSDLPTTAARAALRRILAIAPDVICLQEWFLTRTRALRSWGPVQLLPSPIRLPGRLSGPDPAGTGGETGGGTRGGQYLWAASGLGDTVIGVRADRWQVQSAGLVLIDRPGRGERTDRPGGLEPPRWATAVAVAARIEPATALSVLSFHLTPGVERGGHYRGDRPRLVARHRGEVTTLGRWAAREAHHRPDALILAAGDTNHHRLAVPGLISAWNSSPSITEHEPPPTFGGPGTGSSPRTIDDCFGNRPATSARTLEIGSDHRAVIATYSTH